MTLVVLITAIIVLILVLELISYYIISKLGFIPLREFPRLNYETIKKFKTFDPEIGHCPIAGSKTYDIDLTGKRYQVECNYDDLAGRKNSFSNNNVAASCFGDSFCQCRGVDDDETFQYYLSERIGKYVRNFGVGGHGIDQALLRYERLRKSDLGDLIIVAFSVCTIERIQGVYKNYIEYGNSMGIKPRYKLEGNQLKLINQPISNSFELLKLRKLKTKIRSVDENYKVFKKTKAKLPYSYFIFKNKNYLNLWLYQTLKNTLFNILSQRCLGHLSSKITDLQRKTKSQFYASKNKYFATLYEKRLDLFLAIVDEFNLKVTQDGRKIIYLFLPDYTNISFINEEKYHYYSVAIDNMRNVKGYKVLDSYDFLRNANPKNVFLKDNYAGHHTPKGNELIADFIINNVRI